MKEKKKIKAPLIILIGILMGLFAFYPSFVKINEEKTPISLIQEYNSYNQNKINYSPISPVDYSLQRNELTEENGMEGRAIILEIPMPGENTVIRDGEFHQEQVHVGHLFFYSIAMIIVAYTILFVLKSREEIKVLEMNKGLYS